MKAEVRQACHEDIQAIAAAMRAADVAEVSASHGHTPEAALASSLEHSTAAWTGLIDGVPVCMFGVGPISILAGRGAPWMLGTDGIDKWPRTFLRRCRPCVAAMLAVYPYLENYVDDRNDKSKLWLRWLGFELDDRTVMLPNGVAFRHFELRG